MFGYVWYKTSREINKEHFCKTFVKIAINATFHVSQKCCKSMETLSCHSNESTRATAIKIIIFVEANVMNISGKFQL